MMDVVLLRAFEAECLLLSGMSVGFVWSSVILGWPFSLNAFTGTGVVYDILCSERR